ncbi:DEAD/DEAH box helicase [Mesomycoplasma conjunctivae]|uniref:DEAD/DEAH box helicase n=1 Tax=Mesomycoplasma conjunctivae TaxID=45361 RepID=UPI003DA30BF2
MTKTDIEFSNSINKDANSSYERLLVNLIDIQKSDSALFTTINNTFYFDLSTVLTPANFKKILSNNAISVPLINQEVDEIIRELESLETSEEVKALAKEKGFELSLTVQKQLKNNVKDGIATLINKFKHSKQTSIGKWKKFAKRAQDINRDRNIWPVHLGFLYISLTIEEKKIFAPLFVKECNVSIGFQGPTLISDGPIKFNHKLHTFLKKLDFDFESDFDFSQFSIDKLFETIKRLWSTHFELVDLDGKVTQNITFDDKIIFHPGVILGFFNVSGDYQRKILETMIKNGEIEDQIEVNIDKNFYKENVDNAIFSDKFTGFFKIQKTNFIQDYAHISSILQNTIIWGPPGTGKSQVISNIIANIIILNKTALVTSQKQAALSVLKKRLKKMAYFCLFILNEKTENNYENFYRPIKEYIEVIENFKYNTEINNIDIFTKYDKTYLKLLKAILVESSKLNNSIEAYNIIKHANKFYAYEIAKNIFEINKKIKINPKQAPKDARSLKIYIYEQLLNKKMSFFGKTYTHFLKEFDADIKLILDNLSNYDDNLENIYKKIVNLNLNNLEYIDRFLKFKLPELQEVNSDNDLFIYQAKKIVDLLNQINLNPEFKKLYDKFRISVTQKDKISPHKFLLKHSEIIKILFPIIVTVPETELPMFEKKDFDYVIIDEASQMFLEEALPLIYLGKTKILVGDHQQMQPMRWFTSKLSQDNENDAFNNIESILEYAQTKGVFSILLDKNYRSEHAALMTFNSKHFYNCDLKVANSFKSSGKNSIEVINVGGIWNGQSNVEESQEVVKIAMENKDKYEKIIILAFNVNQQNSIEKIIFDSYPELEKMIYANKLIVNNLENIQGEEADLIIVSVAYDSKTKLTSTYVARKGGRNALNVATSRAKKKMIICKSISSSDITTSNISKDLQVFKDWIDFLDLSEYEQTRYAKKPFHLENDDHLIIEEEKGNSKLFDLFVEDFVQHIENNFKSVKIRKNYIIGNTTIDVALFNKREFVYGIFLDAFSYKNPKNYILYRDDIDFIKSKNYPVLVVNYIDWKVNKDEILKKIQDNLLNLESNS